MPVSQTALVTGACGFVGSHLVESLASRGWNVTATDLDRSARGIYYEHEISGDRTDKPQHSYVSEIIKESESRFISADITEPDTLKQVFDQPYDVVFHTASLYDYFAEWEALYSVNVEGGRNVGELAASNDVGHFIHWSTLGVCGGASPERDKPIKESAPYNPHNRYGKSKMKQEEVLLSIQENQNLPLTVIRPAPIYGPRHMYGVYHLLLLYRKIGTALIFPIFPESKQLKFPCVHIHDLIQAALYVHQNRDQTVGEIYHVTSEPIKQDDLIEFIANSLGLPIRRFPLPWPLYKLIAGRLVQLAALLEQRAREKKMAPKFPASMATYLKSDFWYTSEKLKKTGFEFRYEDPREGLWSYMTWCKQEGLL